MMGFILLLFFIVLLFFLTRELYKRNWNKKLKVEVRFDRNICNEKDKSFVLEEISNNKLLPLPNIEIDFQVNRNIRFLDNENSMVSDKLYRRDVFSLGAKRKITRKLEINCDKRGFYTVESIGLMANDPFLTEKYVRGLEQYTELYVLPKPVSVNRINIIFNRIMGEVLSRQRLTEDPLEFGGVRDYSISDPMKYINWKASAKSGDLVVNIHDSTVMGRLSIVLECFDSISPIDASLNEESIRIASALCEKSLQAGLSLSVFGNGMDILTGKKLSFYDIKGRNSMPVKKSLAKLSLSNISNSIISFNEINLGNDSTVVFISKNTNHELCRSLSELANENEVLCIIPYKNEKPKLSQLAQKVTVIFWEMGAG